MACVYAADDRRFLWAVFSNERIHVCFSSSGYKGREAFELAIDIESIRNVAKVFQMHQNTVSMETITSTPFSFPSIGNKSIDWPNRMQHDAGHRAIVRRSKSKSQVFRLEERTSYNRTLYRSPGLKSSMMNRSIESHEKRSVELVDVSRNKKLVFVGILKLLFGSFAVNYSFYAPIDFRVERTRERIVSCDIMSNKMRRKKWEINAISFHRR